MPADPYSALEHEIGPDGQITEPPPKRVGWFRALLRRIFR